MPSKRKREGSPPETADDIEAQVAALNKKLKAKREAEAEEKRQEEERKQEEARKRAEAARKREEAKRKREQQEAGGSRKKPRSTATAEDEDEVQELKPEAAGGWECDR